jgi:tryptophan synthase beta chain
LHPREEETMKLNGIDYATYEQDYPDKEGRYGHFGGSYLPPALAQEFAKVALAYHQLKKEEAFWAELRAIRRDFQGRPTPLYEAKRLSAKYGNLAIYLKREDLNHTGAHKLNHTMGEALLAQRLGKRKLIAETGAGQHGVAVATAAAHFGLACDIYMGAVDIEKQRPNIEKMAILGANVIPVYQGQQTLKEAVDAAFDAYLKEKEYALYCIGSAVGPAPFPEMIHDFQRVIGEEAREQFMASHEGHLPERACACVGGGSNSIGLFAAFLNDPVALIGVEPLGKGKGIGENAASITFGKEKVMHGFDSLVLLDEKGEPSLTYSIASGLDYPSVGPEHAFLHEKGRVSYETVSDEEALDAFFELSRLEGIIPAIESSHALAYAIRLAKAGEKGNIIVNLSGRGDKDAEYLIAHYGEKYGIKR